MLDIIPLADLEDGQILEGDSEEKHTLPQDFDLVKFHRGRQFFREHIFSCSIGMYFSLIVGLCVPNLLEALVFTKNSDTPKKAFKRYINTFHHVALWHYGDVWKKGSKANESILCVHHMHKNVAQKMKECKTETGYRKFLSQYDMGVVQSGFMGSIVMYSSHLGIKCSQSDIDDYVYFWYGIGHLLGIKKRYNICAHGTSQALSFCKDIEDIVFKNLQNPPKEFEPMAKAVIQAFQWSQFFTLVTLPVATSLLIDSMSRKRAWLSLPDSLRFYAWKLIFCLIRHFSCVRKFLQNVTEKLFNLTFTPVLIHGYN